MALDLPPFDAGKFFVPSAPAIIRPAEHALLKPGAFRPCTREERRAIIADLVRSGRLTNEEAKRAGWWMPVVLANRIVRERGGIDAYTVLMLHCDGANGSTALIDSSASAHVFTAGGSAQISTGQSVFGGASASPNGNAWTCPASADFLLNGDLTIDFRVRLASLKNFNDLSSISPGWPLRFNSSGYISTFLGATPTTNPLVINTWYHIACVRSGITVVIYRNGQIWATSTSSASVGSSSTIVSLGSQNGGTNSLNGHFDEFRVSKGIARWTVPFTPPTRPYYTD